ncbi:Retrovirus-related Pol polyprotein from type-1 retrotransposable element R1 [Eumeta japonica]|uniref:Retrovirus-related Pol polyprotein from type-1 retrotransposable element R1 n=1 Tax=Eumeta variegata TaxID=151549 RepID=A0A4C2ACE7_EUMVA|nr:Retrovirus-related Pol polyprotein from type-1 retrotransposable element R1 [Eumeta japonica]
MVTRRLTAAPRTLCGKCGEIGHKTEECKATVAVRHATDLGDVTPRLTGRRRGIAQHESSRKSDTYPSPDMDKRGGLRVGQINLGGSVVATRELPETARRLGLDLVLVQEQYTSADNIIQTGTTPKAGIMVTRTNLTLTALAHLSTQHCMVAHVGPSDLYVISGYFQYSDRIDPYLEHLGSVLNALRGKRVIVGVDSNVHSPMWHCERRQYTGRGAEAEHRRQQMECFIAERSLMLHNCEGQPATFAGARGESNIDLTLSTRGVAVNDWSVLEDASVSDHRLIVYRVDGVVRSATCAEPMEEPVRFRDRGVDWDVFERTVQMRVGRIRWGAPAAKVAGRSLM